MSTTTATPRTLRLSAGIVTAWGFVFCSFIALCLFGAVPSGAQNLNPRAYWPAPTGTNVISLGYAYTSGGFLADPSLPVEDIDAETHGLTAGYVRVFSLGGRTARVGLTIPRGESTVEGLVEGDPRTRNMSGYADSTLQLSINVKGAPTMSLEDFRGWLRNPKPVLGLTMKLQAPTGAYEPERVVNLGSNRWSAKPEIGYIGLFGHWVTELTGGIRVFEDNDDFQGQVREQNPIASAAAHFGRPFRRANPNFWFSVGVAYAYGGRTTVDGVENDDLQQNWVAGATLAYPFPKGQIARLQIRTSLSTSIGEDSTSALLSYSKAWN